MRRRSSPQAAQVRRGPARRRHFRRHLIFRCSPARRSRMDTIRSEIRTPAFDRYSTTTSLEHATQQAHARNYQDFLIVDVDSHHYENESYKEVFQYIDSPVIRREALIHIERGEIGRASCRE